jgi:hypothetical protein
MTEPNSNTTDTDLPYEDETKWRIDNWYHPQLKRLAKAHDSEGLSILKMAIDGEVAIADLKIKSRQADHAWWFVWVQIGLPALTALIGAFAGAFFKSKP